MSSNQLAAAVGIFILLSIIGFVLYKPLSNERESVVFEALTRDVTLEGTFECILEKGTQIQDARARGCVFGFRSDQGVAYAVNFGSSAKAAELFQQGAHVRAEGNIVLREALSTNQWDAYNIEGIFTITSIGETVPTVNGKISIEAACRSALLYTTFAAGEDAEAYVQECIDGRHPAVIERYKQEMGVSGGVTVE